MLILNTAQGQAVPPKCQKFVLLSVNKSTKRKPLLFPWGEASQELTPMAAQQPWYSLAPAGRAEGWNSGYQEEPLCFWPSQGVYLQLWSCLWSVPLLQVSGQAGLRWVFCKILPLVPTLLI